MSKYTYNKDYFKVIDSADKAYWLGFLYADGCICEKYKNGFLKNMALEITLCNTDRRHLEKLSECLDSNLEIHTKHTRYKGKDYDACRIIISCTSMCKDLIKLGCIPRKTYDIKFPTYDIVPYEYMRDFIRGYFDGDGCIHTGTMSGKKHIELSLTGMKDMLEGISLFLIKEKVLRVLPKIYKDKRSQANNIYLYGTDAVKDILDYLYLDSHMSLDRKYNQYIDFYSNYDYDAPRYGVCYSEKNKAYIVRIAIDGKNVRIGQSKDVHVANQMRIDAEYEKLQKQLNAG